MIYERKAIFRIRRGDGWDVKPEMEPFDGAGLIVSPGWDMGPEDTSIYIGEHAWTVRKINGKVPRGGFENGPAWVATGDLEFVETDDEKNGEHGTL